VNAWTAPGAIYNPRREIPTQQRQHILLVMRNASERRAMAEEFTKAGFTVVAEDNCHDALRFCRKCRVLHALVAEVTLPYMWGVELARSASQFHSRLVIVCLCNAEPRRSVKEELAARGWQWTHKQGPFRETVTQQLQTRLTMAGAR